MPKRKTTKGRSSRAVGLQEKRADEMRWKFDPLAEAANERLLAIRSSGHAENSRAWRRQYLTEAYRLVYELLRDEDPERLKRGLALIIATEGNNQEDRNLFSLAIQALERFDLQKDRIGKKRRAEYASALGYASRHSVPPEAVSGFIAQAGGIKAADKKFKQRGAMEPWATPSLPWPKLQPVT